MANKKRMPIGIDVVTAARQRIKNVFENTKPVTLSFSGGKDSLCLEHLTYELCLSGEIDKSKLTIIFFDEEAIYPCVERIVKVSREKWLSIGVRFNWYSMEYKHFNCLNSLTNDETFICFDRTKKDRWVRDPPSFAIRNHPLLVPGKDSYQSWFLKVYRRHFISMVALRASESIQRVHAIFTSNIDRTGKVYPIYDWTDKDVWKYIYDNNIEFPEAYMYMFQCGVKKNFLRISQFFSVDTIRCLANMCEFYPNLFDRVCAREPNAYMAMMYYDTELFRHKKKDSEYIDYRKKTYEMLNNPVKYNVDMGKVENKRLRLIIMSYSQMFNDMLWKAAYQVLISGDPKLRTCRGIMSKLFSNEYQKGINTND